jgi:hypothetical protein
MSLCSKLLIVVSSLLLSVQTLSGDEMSVAVRQISLRVRSQSDWLTEAKKCPTEVMPQHESRIYLEINECEHPSQLGTCFSRCTAGDAGSCYWLAYAMQHAGGESSGFEPLYQRSCQLGVMSGCTNRAAGILAAAPESRVLQQCAAQTFAKVCAFDDPWACTMYALHLSRGLGVTQDIEQALEVLKKSCKYGPEDPACGYGAKLKEEIERARKNASSHE